MSTITAVMELTWFLLTGYLVSVLYVGYAFLCIVFGTTLLDAVVTGKFWLFWGQIGLILLLGAGCYLLHPTWFVVQLGTLCILVGIGCCFLTLKRTPIMEEML